MTVPDPGSPDEGPEAFGVTVPLVSPSGPGVAPPGAACAFGAGETVGGRYRIVAFVAQGGMGEVYEAEDLELHERVALKTIRPEVANAEGALARFRREIQLARKVTHPNVCRTFDLGHHHDEAPTEGGHRRDVAFATMELLGGETLAARLRRAGRMPVSEALPLVEQMAAGLAAAHRAGVVHGDCSANNVQLVPGADGAVRAVVTDFGLARGASAGDAEVTHTGDLVGSPAYMAPEQVRGKRPTAATDIYALGVILYEVVTGVLPFRAETPLATALARLERAPESPRRHRPELGAAWESAILRCLARDPARRFASALDVAAALRAPPRRRPVAHAAALALAVAGAIAAAFCVGSERSQDRPSAGAPRSAAPTTGVPGSRARPSVAIMGFKHLADDPRDAWISTALGEMLATELAAGERIRVVSGEDVARAKQDLRLAEAETFARPTLARIQANLDADYLVLGSYIVQGTDRRLRLDVRLQQVASGETVASVVQLGNEAELIDVVARTGVALRGRLGAGASPVTESRPALPATSETARLYAEGLARLRAYELGEARDLLERAVALEPTHAQLRSALAQALEGLGFAGRAREEARQAFELSRDLPRQDRLLIEARYHEALEDYPRAVEIYGTLWEFFPDNLDYGLRLAGAQVSARRSAEAEVTLQTVAREIPGARDDPRFLLAEATAAAASDYRRALEAARRCYAAAEARGARRMLAEAKRMEGLAWQNLGQPEQAIAAITDAQRLYLDAGDRFGNAAALGMLARTYQDMGQLEQALRWQREITRTWQSFGNDSRRLNSLIAEADMRRAQGDPVGALRDSAPLLAEMARRDWPYSKAVCHIVRSQAYLALGQLESARGEIELAMAVAGEAGSRRLVAFAETVAAAVALAEGDVGAARRQYEHALAEREALGLPVPVAAIRIALAEVALAEGRSVEAEAQLRPSCDVMARARHASGEAACRALHARALVGSGQPAEALASAVAAEASAGRTEELEVRLRVAALAAVVRAAAGPESDRKGVTERLIAAETEARRRGLLPAALEGGLAAAQVDLAGGAVGPARRRLAALEVEARRAGLTLLASQAASLRAR